MQTASMPEWLAPYGKLAKGENPGAQLAVISRQLCIPVLGFVLFLFAWHFSANSIETSLGKFPGPSTVWEQGINLWQEHKTEREKEVDFYARQEERNQARLKIDPDYDARIRPYTGKPTFLDQIGTSLVTVMCGFLIASIIAIPLGILLGLSANLYAGINPLIQILKPISPLAWLPLVTMVVSAVYTTEDPEVSKSFLNSMITVTLCSLWPTVINTTLGVTSVSKDLVNVSQVLRLNKLTHIIKIVIPSSIPMIFTGLRLSLGIAWMVLIAAEMLAQNPGLGKFVWDEFQNGSSQSLGRIMVAVIVIGVIGFLLDRSMLLLQKTFSWDKQSVIR